MKDLADLKTAVVDYLRTAEGFTGVRVLTSHPAVWRESPLRKAAVAVGVDAVEAAPGGLGGYWGNVLPGRGAEGPMSGAGAAITLRFDLYAPPDSGGDGPEALYEALCDGLMLRENPFSAQKLWCGEAAYDNRAGAWHMTAHALLRTALLRREGGAPIEAFRVKRALECAQNKKE